MFNPMDRAGFVQTGNRYNNFSDLQQAFEQARRNPREFEERIRQNNPQAYERACQIRNSMTPQNAVMQAARARGINPNFFKMLGL